MGKRLLLLGSAAMLVLALASGAALMLELSRTMPGGCPGWEAAGPLAAASGKDVEAGSAPDSLVRFRRAQPRPAAVSIEEEARPEEVQARTREPHTGLRLATGRVLDGQTWAPVNQAFVSQERRGKRAARARTDESGCFELSDPDAENPLRVSALGYSDAICDLRRVASSDVGAILLLPDPTRQVSLSGRIVDLKTLQGIEAATVTLQATSRESWTSTGCDGDFELPCPPSGSQSMLIAEHEGYLGAFVPVRGESDLQLALVKIDSSLLRYTCGPGLQIAGADAGFALDPPSPYRVSLPVRTDAAGEFHFPRLLLGPGGRVLVSVEQDCAPPAMAVLTAEQIAGQAQFELRAPDPVDLKGEVREADGSPLAQGALEGFPLVEGWSGRSAFLFLAGVESGSFRSKAAFEGKWVLRLTDAAGLRWIGQAELGGGAPVLISLPAPGRMECRVADREGRALSGASVLLTCSEGGGPAPVYWQEKLSGKDGRASFEALCPGRYELAVSHPEHSSWTGSVDLEAGALEVLDVLCAPFGAVEGRVSWRRIPAPSCMVVIEGNACGQAGACGRRESALPQGEARFRFGCLRQGTVVVRAMAGNRMLGEVSGVRVEAGGTTAVVIDPHE